MAPNDFVEFGLSLRVCIPTTAAVGGECGLPWSL